MTANLWGSAATFKQCIAEKISFVLLNQVDLVLTFVAISFGLNELNPLMRYLFAMPLLLLVVKFIIPLLIAWLAPGKLLLPSIVLLALFVAWNLKELVFWVL